MGRWRWPKPHIRFDTIQIEDGPRDIGDKGSDAVLVRGNNYLCTPCLLVGLSASHWMRGVVAGTAKFGVFVDVKAYLSGDITVRGLVHVSEMNGSWSREPSSEFSEGQEVDVRILEV